MSTGSLESRWAREADVLSFYEPPLPTMRARVVLIDGEPAGIAGWRMEGEMAYVFSKMTERLRPLRKVILREARRVMADLGDLPAYCVADPEIPGAARFLKRLGWRHVCRTSKGEVFTWQKLS